MYIQSQAIVSNSDMIKNYKTCRDKAELYGSVFILKNNWPDAVLLPISKYERFAKLIEYIESHKVLDIVKVMDAISMETEKPA